MPGVAELVQRWALELTSVGGDILDLACGRGQNGLFLAQRMHEHGKDDFRVVLLDKDIEQATKCTINLPEAVKARIEHRKVDLEMEDDPQALPRNAYGGVLVFNYLHRPLLPVLRASIKPGGLLLYRTFTWEHPPIGGRPSNPAFLLGPSELKEIFEGWEVLEFFEGVEEGRRAVSSIVCRKPSALYDGEVRV